MSKRYKYVLPRALAISLLFSILIAFAKDLSMTRIISRTVICVLACLMFEHAYDLKLERAEIVIPECIITKTGEKVVFSFRCPLCETEVIHTEKRCSGCGTEIDFNCFKKTDMDRIVEAVKRIKQI